MILSLALSRSSMGFNTLTVYISGQSQQTQKHHLLLVFPQVEWMILGRERADSHRFIALWALNTIP
jgi:hypothetical protein